MSFSTSNLVMNTLKVVNISEYICCFLFNLQSKYAPILICLLYIVVPWKRNSHRDCHGQQRQKNWGFDGYLWKIRADNLSEIKYHYCHPFCPIVKPEARSQSKVQAQAKSKKGKGNLSSGLSLKSYKVQIPTPRPPECQGGGFHCFCFHWQDFDQFLLNPGL